MTQYALGLAARDNGLDYRAFLPNGEKPLRVEEEVPCTTPRKSN